MALHYNVLVVGGGPAGLAAACSAKENGAERVLIIERDKVPGGILNQCIHNGFGLHHFKEELTGPEYADRFIKQAQACQVELMLDTMVLSVDRDRTVHAMNARDGAFTIKADAVVLAMGCRERTRGAIATPGDRPAGVLTAGTAQRYINMEGWMVGRRVVILGSGDIGLIMARRMTLEGAKVLACVELMPFSNGLNRNIVQCLNDYHIPLYLSHTITHIQGRERVEQVTIAEVDSSRKPIPGTEKTFDCDTVLLSVGLIPENELTKAAGVPIDPRTGGAVVYENTETDVPGVFACGNVLHVHDLVDYETAERQRAGKAAAAYALGAQSRSDGPTLTVANGTGVSYTVPQRIRPSQVERAAEVFFRVNGVYHNKRVTVSQDGRELCSFKREHLAPGEMQRITIPKQLLDSACGELTVALEDAEEARA